MVDELVELLAAHTDFDDPTVCVAIAALLRQHSDVVRRSIGCGHGDSMFPIGGGVRRCAICGATEGGD